MSCIDVMSHDSEMMLYLLRRELFIDDINLGAVLI